MSIDRVEVVDLLVFNGKFSADFCSGINVLIGSNGTGKTTLMKILYWGCEISCQAQPIDDDHLWFAINKPDDNYITLNDYFIRDSSLGTIDNGFRSKVRVFSNDISSTSPCFDVEMPEDLSAPTFKLADNDDNNRAFYEWCSIKTKAVFIPSTEMLSHSKGFLALNRERPLPFDNTEINIVSKAELAQTRTVTPNAKRVIDKISSIIGGQVDSDGKNFYIYKPENRTDRIYFPFEASGFRKLGLLWKLLRNGLLEKGAVLFWDEPENSLNPEHIPVIVDVLLELSRNGVQIFLATHSEIFASYFAANRKKSDNVMYHTLFKNNDKIEAASSNRFDLLEPNTLTNATVQLYKKEVETGLGNE